MAIDKDIRSLLDKAFGQGIPEKTGDNYAVSCPACKGNNKNKKKLIVHLRKMWYHCWVCDLKGRNVVWLIKKYRPDLISIDDNYSYKAPEVVVEEEPPLELPNGHRFLGLSAIDPDISATKKYLRARGLVSDDIYRWRILATPSGPFRRKAIIPSFDAEGNLNYYVARAIDQTPYKYRNAKVPKKSIIFNEIDINWKKPIILVEGVFDAINCPDNTIPILGSSLTKEALLYSRILEHQPEVTVALDPDLKMKAYKIAKMLKATGSVVKIAFAPADKDFGDLNKKEVKDILASATIYEDFDRISYKISTIRTGTIF